MAWNIVKQRKIATINFFTASFSSRFLCKQKQLSNGSGRKFYCNAHRLLLRREIKFFSTFGARIYLPFCVKLLFNSPDSWVIECAFHSVAQLYVWLFFRTFKVPWNCLELARQWRRFNFVSAAEKFSNRRYFAIKVITETILCRHYTIFNNNKLRTKCIKIFLLASCLETKLLFVFFLISIACKWDIFTHSHMFKSSTSRSVSEWAAGKKFN